jgi:hypothetical protein
MYIQKAIATHEFFPGRDGRAREAGLGLQERQGTRGIQPSRMPGWQGLSRSAASAEPDFGVSQLLCVGSYGARFCQLRFPDLPVVIVPVCIDQNLFRFQGEKKLQIACLVRKRPWETAVIHDLFLAANPDFRGVPWVEINNLSESQVAATLRETAVSLSPCRDVTV